MAVSFNIPKSPKRDIFVIENFQGVDFTNIGAAVDASRSPNAPNMIRHVPGKVRKRMGYEKYIQFSALENVNFAKTSSSKATTIVFSPSIVGTTVKLTDTTIRLESENAFTLYLEFDYKSPNEFVILDDITVPASEEWTHYSGSKVYQAGDYVEFVGIYSSTQQNVGIKEFSIMKARSASYRWSPAPRFFVENYLNNYVYGCHIYKAFETKRDRVTNVNRVLNTSNSFRTISVTSSWVADSQWSLANLLWTDERTGVRVWIDFDYTLTGSSNVFMAVATYYSSAYKMTPTSTTKHMSYPLNTGSYSDKNIKFKCETSGATASLKIKNLSICYRVDNNYAWSRAPEDTGGTFPVEDVYTDGMRNYSEIDNYALDFDTSSNHDPTPYNYFILVDMLNPEYSEIAGFVHLSFDLYAITTATDLQKIEVSAVYGAGVSAAGTYAEKRTENGNIINKHYDFYVSSGSVSSAVNAIGIKYYFPSEGDRSCSFRVSNIKLKRIYPGNVYNGDASEKIYYLYHVGQYAYIKGDDSDSIERVSLSLARNRSWAQQLDETLVLLDGTDIYTYKLGQSELAPITQREAYVPTLTISKKPMGGGISYESLNMLQPGFYERFYCDSSDANQTHFQLSFGNLDQTKVSAWVLSSNGNWVARNEGVHFSVNRTTGLITFNSAPGQTPIGGEDNVKILAYRTVEGYRDRIAKCKFGTLFGVGGAADRLFVSGNPDYPNQDFYSGQYDPTYFPDTGYSKLGTSSSEIVGYAKINNFLATFKRGIDKSQNVIVREGDLVVKKQSFLGKTVETSEPAFKVINALQGEGALTPFAFGYMQTEPIYLTSLGIMAITAQDITGEKYGQNRSYYLNEQLLKEENLEDAMATVFKDMYILAVNGHLYVLDGLQIVRSDKGDPYSARQYCGFYCTNIPATCIWTDDKYLFFGTEDGKICRFYSEVSEPTSYNDDGKPIEAWWETPDLDGKLFYKNKTFRYFAIRMMQALKTSCKLYSRKMSNWTEIKEDRSSGVVLDFENIDFENFSFSTDISEKVVHTKLRVKKVDKARFKVENSNLNEPFGLFDLALEYVESGNYKR